MEVKLFYRKHWLALLILILLLLFFLLLVPWYPLEDWEEISIQQVLTWSQSAAITEEMDLQHIPLYLRTLQIWPLPLSAPPEEGFLVKFLYDEEPWELVVGPRKAVLRRMGHTRGFSVKTLLSGMAFWNRPSNKKQAGKLNCTPFVRQYGILSNKWGVLLCQKEYQTNDIRQNSKNW